MPKKSAASDVVQRSAEDTSAAMPDHLADLLAAMDEPIDTTEIPEAKGPVRRVKRDANGRLPKPIEGPIRSAILAALGRRKMTRYQLWQAARVHCETLTASAVYEYLRGQRDIGVPYVEAILTAAGLVVVPEKTARSRAIPTAIPKPTAVKPRRPKANA